MLDNLNRRAGGVQLTTQRWYTRANVLRLGSLHAPRPFLYDLAIALCLFLIGCGVGALDVSRWTNNYEFRQARWGSAVMLACNRGFVEPAQRIPTLEQFLSDKKGDHAFSCDDIPGQLRTKSPTAFAHRHRYLYGSVALVWSMLGVSWSALTPLFAVFYGATITFTYGLFRLLTNRLLAIGGSLVWMFSALHLTMLPALRDYSKAPFILASLLLVGYLVSRSVRWPALIIASALCGSLLGVGTGFRADVLIAVPPVVLCILLFLPGKLTTNIPGKVLAIAVFLGAFFATSWPILLSPSTGSNTFHVLMFGFDLGRNGPLGVTNPSYEWLYLASDQGIQTVVNSYAYCLNEGMEPLERSMQLYDQMTAQYFMRIVLSFPADILTRVYGSVLSILAWPLAGLASYPRLLVFVVATATLLALSRHSVRLATFVGFVVLYFVGYEASYFSPRHYFHMGVIPLLFMGMIAQQGIRVVGALVRRRSTTPSPSASQHELSGTWWRSPATRQMVGFAVGSVLVLALPLYALRWYQQGHVAELRAQYVNAELESLAVSSTPTAGDKVLVSPRDFPGFVRQAEKPDQPAVHAEYLVVDVDANQGSIPLTFRYARPKSAVWEHTRTIVLDEALRGPDRSSSTMTRLYVPVFAGAELQFEGVEGPKQAMSSVKMYQVRDSCQFPMLLLWQFPPNWREAKLYQTLTLASSIKYRTFDRGSVP